MIDRRLYALRAILPASVPAETARRALAAADAAMWRKGAPPYGTTWALAETPDGIERVRWSDTAELWADQRGHPVRVLRWALAPRTHDEALAELLACREQAA